MYLMLCVMTIVNHLENCNRLLQSSYTAFESRSFCEIIIIITLL